MFVNRLDLPGEFDFGLCAVHTDRYSARFRLGIFNANEDLPTMITAAEVAFLPNDDVGVTCVPGEVNAETKQQLEALLVPELTEHSAKFGL